MYGEQLMPGGKKAGKRGQNSWPVDLLVKGDVYVPDQFGAHKNGATQCSLLCLKVADGRNVV